MPKKAGDLMRIACKDICEKRGPIMSKVGDGNNPSLTRMQDDEYPKSFYSEAPG